MPGRVKEHPLELEAVGCLDVGALGDRHPRPAQPVGQLVTNLLELSEVEQPRIGAAGTGAVLETTHRVGGQEGLRELMLDPGDLISQRTPRSQLGERRSSRTGAPMLDSLISWSKGDTQPPSGEPRLPSVLPLSRAPYTAVRISAHVQSASSRWIAGTPGTPTEKTDASCVRSAAS